MITLFKLGLRNIFRNKRRSQMTLSALVVGTVTILLVGQLSTFIILATQTLVVRRLGHLSINKTGYFKFGSGNPLAYSLGDYQSIISMVNEDPVLKPLVSVVMPSITFYGIAGNYEADTSKSVYGTGVIPALFEKMSKWDGYGFASDFPKFETGLSETNISRGYVGLGVARVLSICEQLKTDDCPPRPKLDEPAARPDVPDETRDFSGLPEIKREASSGRASDGAPKLDILAATALGSPNIVTLEVANAVQQTQKEVDDNFIGLNFDLAQQLVFGRGEKKAVSIVIQVNQTKYMKAVQERLEALVRERKLDLEVLNYTDLSPLHKSTISFFWTIFYAVTLVMGLIVLFTVSNVMSMTVIERTTEIGTIRSLGLKRRGVRLQFLIEGLLLGLVGATIGVILEYGMAYVINHMGLTWLPPGAVRRLPLKAFVSESHHFALFVWLGLIIASGLASFFPASRAANMKIVEALGHV